MTKFRLDQSPTSSEGRASSSHPGRIFGPKWATSVAQRKNGHGDAGAVLILALVYIIVISVTVGALAYWATNDINNTGVFFSGTQLQFAASAATKTAIQSIRATPEPATPANGSALTSVQTLITGTNTAGNAFDPSAQLPFYGECWTPVGGSGPSTITPINGLSITVWCSTGENLAGNVITNGGTRVVTVYACLSTVAEASCISSPILKAVYSFDDYPLSGGQQLTAQCNPTYSTCGEGSTEVSWVYTKTDGS
jgi:hypothetical protein